MINDISLYISYWLYHILHYDTLSSMHMRINKPVLHRFKKNMFLAENFRITGGKQMVHTECSYIYFIFIFSEVNLLFKWFITTTWKHLVLINDGIRYSLFPCMIYTYLFDFSHEYMKSEHIPILNIEYCGYIWL